MYPTYQDEISSIMNEIPGVHSDPLFNYKYPDKEIDFTNIEQQSGVPKSFINSTSQQSPKNNLHLKKKS